MDSVMKLFLFNSALWQKIKRQLCQPVLFHYRLPVNLHCFLCSYLSSKSSSLLLEKATLWTYSFPSISAGLANHFLVMCDVADSANSGHAGWQYGNLILRRQTKYDVFTCLTYDLCLCTCCLCCQSTLTRVQL